MDIKRPIAVIVMAFFICNIAFSSSVPGHTAHADFYSDKLATSPMTDDIAGADRETANRITAEVEYGLRHFVNSGRPLTLRELKKFFLRSLPADKVGVQVFWQETYAVKCGLSARCKAEGEHPAAYEVIFTLSPEGEGGCHVLSLRRSEKHAKIENRHVSQLPLPSILEAAEFNIRKAAAIMKLDPGLLNLILNPKKITSVKFQVQLDDGDSRTFHAFRALQNDALGPGKGGMRWLIGRGETIEEAMKTAVGLATLMTTKNAVIGIPYGGAKGDVFVEARAYTDNDKFRIVRAFSHELVKKRAVGPFTDVPAPDKGTDARMMACFLDQALADLTKAGEIFDKIIEAELEEVKPSNDLQKTPYLDRYIDVLNNDKDGMLQGFEIGMVTGKPVNKGGSAGRTKATGFGGFIALKEILKHFAAVDDLDKDVVGSTLNDKTRSVLKMDLKQMDVAIQGTGNVGEYHAWELYRAGVLITMLEDAALEDGEYITYTLYGPKGIDIELLNKNLDRLPDGRWALLKTLSDEFLKKFGYRLIRNDRKIFWRTHTVIKVPAATENVITSLNIEDVNCEIVLELANDPTTPDADERLRERGILVVPDIFANTGGVGFSYYEWLQNIEGRYHEEATLDKMFEERMGIEADMVFAFSEKYKVDLRTAAYILYLARVANAEIARSDELSSKFAHRNPYMHYGRMGLFPATIEELNRVITEGRFERLVMQSEDLVSSKIDAIVGMALDKFPPGKTGFVLTSGSTTSGKLGFAVNLARLISLAGRKVVRLNFDELRPEDLKALKGGQEITAVDYIAGEKKVRTIKPGEGDIFIVEGNYAIAKEVLNIIPEGSRITVWINKIPSMKLENNWPLTSLDIRLLGHILTLYCTEDKKAIDVIRNWPAERNVQMEKVFPSWANADITFNAYLPYELPVIKFYAEGMVAEAMEEARRDNDKASLKIIERLQRTLKGVIAVKAPGYIPSSSIMQQYIGNRSFYDTLIDAHAAFLTADEGSGNAETDGLGDIAFAGLEARMLAFTIRRNGQAFEDMHSPEELDAIDRQIEAIGQEIDRRRAEASAKIKEVADEDAVWADRYIPTSESARYKVLVDNSLCTDDELKADIIGFDTPSGIHIGAADRFDLERINTSSIGSILNAVVEPERTILQISRDLTEGELIELKTRAPKLRVVRVDTADIDVKYGIRNKASRQMIRFDLYNMMLWARRVTADDIREHNSIYRSAELLIRMRLGEDMEAHSGRFIEELVKDTEGLSIIVKFNLSYRPSERWRVPEQHLVTLVTLSA